MMTLDPADVIKKRQAIEILKKIDRAVSELDCAAICFGDGDEDDAYSLISSAQDVMEDAGNALVDFLRSIYNIEEEIDFRDIVKEEQLSHDFAVRRG